MGVFECGGGGGVVGVFECGGGGGGGGGGGVVGVFECGGGGKTNITLMCAKCENVFSLLQLKRP